MDTVLQKIVCDSKVFCEFCLISDIKPVNFTYLKYCLAIIKSFSHFLFE